MKTEGKLKSEDINTFMLAAMFALKHLRIFLGNFRQFSEKFGEMTWSKTSVHRTVFWEFFKIMVKSSGIIHGFLEIQIFSFCVQLDVELKTRSKRNFVSSCTRTQALFSELRQGSLGKRRQHCFQQSTGALGCLSFHSKVLIGFCERSFFNVHHPCESGPLHFLSQNSMKPLSDVHFFLFLFLCKMIYGPKLSLFETYTKNISEINT